MIRDVMVETNGDTKEEGELFQEVVHLVSTLWNTKETQSFIAKMGTEKLKKLLKSTAERINKDSGNEVTSIRGDEADDMYQLMTGAFAGGVTKDGQHVKLPPEIAAKMAKAVGRVRGKLLKDQKYKDYRGGEKVKDLKPEERAEITQMFQDELKKEGLDNVVILPSDAKPGEVKKAAIQAISNEVIQRAKDSGLPMAEIDELRKQLDERIEKAAESIDTFLPGDSGGTFTVDSGGKVDYKAGKPTFKDENTETIAKNIFAGVNMSGTKFEA